MKAEGATVVDMWLMQGAGGHTIEFTLADMGSALLSKGHGVSFGWPKGGKDVAMQGKGGVRDTPTLCLWNGVVSAAQ